VRGRYLIVGAAGGKSRTGRTCGQQKGGLLEGSAHKIGVKLSADMGVSKTIMPDSEAGNDDFLTTEELI